MWTRPKCFLLPGVFIWRQFTSKQTILKFISLMLTKKKNTVVSELIVVARNICLTSVTSSTSRPWSPSAAVSRSPSCTTTPTAGWSSRSTRPGKFQPKTGVAPTAPRWGVSVLILTTALRWGVAVLILKTAPRWGVAVLILTTARRWGVAVLILQALGLELALVSAWFQIKVKVSALVIDRVAVVIFIDATSKTKA